MSTLSDLTADVLNTQEPQRGNNILLHIVNTPNGGSSADAELVLALESFNLPESTNNVIQMGYLNEVRNYAGKVQFPEIQVTYKDLVTSSVYATLLEWRRLVYDPANGKIGFAASSNGYKRNGYVLMYASNGTLARQWDVHGIWPSSFNPGNMDMMSDDYVPISVSFVIDKVVLGTAGTPPADYQSAGA